MKIKPTSVLTVISAIFATAACGAPANTGKGPISEARTAAFKALLPNFGNMGRMVRGAEPYDVEKFKTMAAAFVEDSKKPFEHFQKDEKGDGDTLPVTWERPQAFQAEVEKFYAAVAELNTQAQTGRLGTIRTAYGRVGASCKSCHDTFRRPK